MLKYIVGVFVTIIGFLSLFGIVMIPFSSGGADPYAWLLGCSLALSIQMTIFAIYFNNKDK